MDSRYTYDRAVQVHRGATRTRPGGAARTLPGGATRTRSDADSCVLPSAATRVFLGGASRTRHPSSSSGSARRAPTLVIVLARRQRGSRLHRHPGV